MLHRTGTSRCPYEFLPLLLPKKYFILCLSIKLFDYKRENSMAIERLVEDLLLLSRLIRPLRRADMTPEQYWFLCHLRRTGPLSLGELAHALGITTGSATVASKRLEKARLLVRERQ